MGVSIIRALLLEVYIRALDFWKLPYLPRHIVWIFRKSYLVYWDSKSLWL